MANVSNSTYDDLIRLNNEKATTLIPVMVFFGMFIVMGVIGNSLVCYIIGFRFNISNQNLLIISLAIFDLISCLLTMPKGILEMRFMYNFPSGALCKLLRFIAAFTCIGSVFVLIVIAAERYRKICKPLAQQFTLGQIKIALMIILTTTTLLSVPTIFIYGIRTYESPVEAQMAHDCFTSDHMVNTPVPIIYTVILFTVFIVCSLFVTVIYGSILFSIKQHRRKMSTINMSVISIIRSKFSSQKHATSPNIKSSEIAIKRGSRNSASDENSNPAESNTAKSSSTDPHSLYLQRHDNDLEEQLQDERRDSSGNESKNEFMQLKISVSSNVECFNGDRTLTTVKNDTHVKSDFSNLKDVLETSLKFLQFHSDPGISDDDNSEHSEKTLEDDRNSNISEVTQTSHVLSQNDCPCISYSEMFKDEKRDAIESRSNNSCPSTSPFKSVKCEGKKEINMVECQSSGASKESRQDESATTSRMKENNADKDKKLPNKKRLSPKTKIKATRIAFLVTLVFTLSFLPHLSLRACKNIFKGFDYNLEGASLIFYNLFLRSYYINSIANPIIYGALNIRFRTEVKILYRKLFSFKGVPIPKIQ